MVSAGDQTGVIEDLESPASLVLDRAAPGPPRPEPTDPGNSTLATTNVLVH